MGSWRIVTAAALGAVLLTACGEEAVVAADSTTSTLAGADQTTVPAPDLTTVAEWAPITFTLGIADDGARLRLRPGDEVVPRLPLTGLSDLGWILFIPPNPAVLGGGDDLLWRPSEIDQGGVAFHEFNFIATGPGETTVTFIHGWQEFTFTVLVAAHQ
jgi:hypothetical protein